MSYLHEITYEEVVNALNKFILANENINTEGRFWKLVYDGYTFSPNSVIRKVGEIKEVRNVHDFKGGKGDNGCITRLIELGFTLIDKRPQNV
jgi:hypothetical protein